MTHKNWLCTVFLFRSDLPTVFRQIMKKYNLAPGDFPDINSFSAKLTETKFHEFNTLSQKQIDDLETVLQQDIPRLMEVREYVCIYVS
jgi:hypothetical protein